MCACGTVSENGVGLAFRGPVDRLKRRRLECSATILPVVTSSARKIDADLSREGVQRNCCQHDVDRRDGLGLLLPTDRVPGQVGEPAGATPDGRRMTTGFTV